MSFLILLSNLAFSATWYQKALDLDLNETIIVKNTVVAVIDTGVDTQHPALKNALWTNPGEIPDNGIDDDKNGYVDDIHGWNFAAENSNVKDNHGHGTHIAGLIAGNSKEFTGIAPGTKIMVLKYFDPQAPGGANLMNTVRAIKYALRMGATIINYSGGGSDPHPLEKLALLEAAQKDILVVAAAGNESSDSDVFGFYPASYDLKNILSVAAMGADSKRVPSSNWGATKVKIVAPGEQILSLLPNSGVGYMTGTSQATAMVTGLAVLLKEKRPELEKPEDIIRVLTATGSFNSHFIGKIHNPQKASAKRALYMASDFSSEEDKSLSTFRP